jgi:hypothetical protein
MSIFLHLHREFDLGASHIYLPTQQLLAKSLIHRNEGKGPDNPCILMILFIIRVVAFTCVALQCQTHLRFSSHKHSYRLIEDTILLLILDQPFTSFYYTQSPFTFVHYGLIWMNPHPAIDHG